MKFKRQISILLAFVLTLGCFGFSPASAQQAQTDAVTNSSPSPVQTDDLTKDSQILDHVDAEQFQNAGHIARLPGEETLDSYVFLNGDGTKSVYYMGSPVKYVDENGTIREKDTTLVRRNGGYGMRDNDVALHIPDTAANGITLTYNNCTVKLTPQGGSGVAQQEDNSIVYANYFGRGTFLRYTPMLSGMKEDIILAKYTGQNSFTFLLETGGLRLYETEGSYYLAENEDAEAAFHLGQILVYDAIGRPDLGSMTAETLVPGQRYRLTVSADEAFLTDPQTVYPVTIDPTLTVRDAQSEDHTLEDAPVFSDYPNWHCGDYVYNSMGYVEGMGTAMTAIRLTGLLADSNYSQLTEAQLNNVTFYIRSAGSEYANISVHALTENSTWTEMGITWNNIGAYSETSYANADMGNVFWAAFDITNLAKDWKNGTQNPQCGFVLVSDSNTRRTATYAAEYGTADNRPYVVVNYNNQLTVTPSSDTMYVGESMPLTAISNPAGQAVSWASDTSTVASVDENGVVTGLSAGTATITATLADGTFASCEIEVRAKSISLNYNTSDNPAILYKGDTVSIEVTTQPANEEVEWESLSPEIATVSNEGEVTGVSPGRAIIRAILNDAEATCVVIVTDWEIWLDEENLVLAVGESYDIDADTIPPGLPYNWSTGDADVAVVDDDGLITAMGVGQTYITAMLTDGQTVGCFVEVVEKQIVIEAENNDVDEGSTLNLTARTTPENRAVSWNSSNTAIATVDQNGLITGIEAGVTTITASMDNGPSATYTVYVTVADGVYYISNEFSGLYLQTEERKITGFTNLVQHNKLASTDAETSRIAQMWRITYLDEGMYTIRPLSKLNMCLYADWSPSAWAESAVIYPHAEDDYEDVPLRAQWTITKGTRGYIIKYCGVDEYSLQTAGGSGAVGAEIVVGAYHSGYSCHWSLELETNVPTGIVLYDLNTGLPADTSITKYIAPKQELSMFFMGLEIATYPERSLEQDVHYRVINSALASISNSGTVTGIQGGQTSVYISIDLYGGVDILDASFPIVITIIPEGTYFLCNKTTGCYADIDGQVMENNRTIHQWELHGGNTQKWTFTHLGDGTYSIHSENSTTKYYLGIKDDSSTLDQDVVLRTGSITSGMKWSVTPGTNGAFILTPKTGENNNYVLATSTSNATNGKKLIQGEYINNNSYRDEWLLQNTVFTLSLNIYYDQAFAVRHTTAESLLNSFQPQINDVFGKVFGLYLGWNTPQEIYSTPDFCKTYRGLGINANTINSICPANPHFDEPYCSYCNVRQGDSYENCTSWYQIYRDFIEEYPGNDLTTSVLFTGSALYNDNGVLCNRSYGWYNNGLLLQNISSSTADYYKDVFSTLVHEISHEIGARDHYHEILEDEQGNEYCRGGENCFKCNEETGRPMWCIMDQGRITNPDNINTKNLYCPACLKEILEHLADHHAN